MFKKVFPWLVIIILIALLVGLFMMKDGMNIRLSKMMQAQAGSEISSSGEAFIDSASTTQKMDKASNLPSLNLAQIVRPANAWKR